MVASGSLLCTWAKRVLSVRLLLSLSQLFWICLDVAKSKLEHKGKFDRLEQGSVSSLWNQRTAADGHMEFSVSPTELDMQASLPWVYLKAYRIAKFCLQWISTWCCEQIESASLEFSSTQQCPLKWLSSTGLLFFFLLRDLHWVLFEKEFIDLKLGQFNLVAGLLYVSIIYSCLCGKLSWWGN